jgi:hypothetical protein
MNHKNNQTEEEDIYAEIGVQCPYLLAKQQGVKLATFSNEIGDICGIYRMTGRDTYTILLNPAIDLETEESTVYLLLKHHNSESKGIQRCVFKNDLKFLNKIVRETKKVSSMIADIFLKGPLSQK